MSASRPINEGEVCNARIVELELDPVRGTFDAAHLQEIHRRIFQDLLHHNPGEYGFQQVFEELPRRSPVSLVYGLDDRELLVRSMPTNRYILPSAVRTSAISIWKKPMG